MLNFSFKDKKFKIVEKFFIFLAISIAIILAGVIDICVRGMNIGIEFSAGATVQITVSEEDVGSQDAFKSKFEKWLAGDKDGDGHVDAGAREFDVASNTQTSVANGEITFEFKVGTTVKEDGKTVDLTAKVTDELSEHYNDTLLVAYISDVKNEIKDDVIAYLGLEEDTEEVSVVTHTINNDVMLYTVRTAFIAAAVAVAVILIYIAIRFTLISGLAAILALIHDVLIMVALTTFFQVPVNSTFIAAVITIIGYSINATIVIFDRIRELEKTPSLDGEDDKVLANKAIASTLTRSILTTVTTLVMIAVLAIFGTATIREFAYPIIFGLLAGAYSSVLLSSSIWVYLRKLFKQSGKRPTQKAKKEKTTTVNA